MKYYKLIYTVEREIEKQIQEHKDWIDDMNAYNKLHFPDHEMYDYDEDEIESIKKNVEERYAWYESGIIYSEDETHEGQSVIVSEMLEEYPEDWLEVSEEEFENQLIPEEEYFEEDVEQIDSEKTAIQELISKLEEIKNTNCKTLHEVVFFDGVLAVIEAENYIQKEKQQIVNAFNKDINANSGEEYYKQKFNK